MISPSCSATAGRRASARRRGSVQRLDNLVGDVVLRVDVDGFLQDQVVLFLLRDLAHHAVGAVQHLLQFLVLARVQVFLEFAALALELAPEVRVNAVSPGAILWPEAGKPEAAQSELMARTPLARTGRAGEIAEAVRWLLRDATYTTGQVIRVDGGRSVVG